MLPGRKQSKEIAGEEADLENQTLKMQKESRRDDKTKRYVIGVREPRQ